jgi:hypothetical protein
MPLQWNEDKYELSLSVEQVLLIIERSSKPDEYCTPLSGGPPRCCTKPQNSKRQCGSE